MYINHNIANEFNSDNQYDIRILNIFLILENAFNSQTLLLKCKH